MKSVVDADGKLLFVGDEGSTKFKKLESQGRNVIDSIPPSPGYMWSFLDRTWTVDMDKKLAKDSRDEKRQMDRAAAKQAMQEIRGTTYTPELQGFVDRFLKVIKYQNSDL